MDIKGFVRSYLGQSLEVCSQIAKAMMEILEELENELEDERIDILKAYLEMLRSCVKGADIAISLIKIIGKDRFGVN